MSLLSVTRVLGEYRIRTADGIIVGPDTEQNGFDGSVLLALRALRDPPECDSLGYVWPSREAAEQTLRRVRRRNEGKKP